MTDGLEVERRKGNPIGGCDGKEAMTRRVAAMVAKRHGIKGRTAYRCAICRRWHVGARGGPMVRRS